MQTRIFKTRLLVPCSVKGTTGKLVSINERVAQQEIQNELVEVVRPASVSVVALAYPGLPA
jgi:hypothetical protein